MKKHLALLALSAAFLSGASAATVLDTFNRANTGPQTDNPNAIGTDWTIQRGTWEILNQRVTDPAGGTPGVLTWNSLQSSNTGGNFFTTSSIMACTQAGGLMMGMVFNFQDMNNYYAFRFDTDAGHVQWLTVSGGSESAVFTDFNAFVPVLGRDYRVTVASSTAYIASFEIFDTVTSSVVYSRGATEDSSHLFTDGYAGLYSNFTASTYSFDSFELTSVPEPSQIALLVLGAGAVLMTVRKRTRLARA
jgi:hypothetical protein